MAIEVIDGTIGTVTVKRSTSRVVLHDCITIRTTDGAERRLDKVAVAPDVAAALQPGTEGRFYGYKAIDHRGLYGFRTRDGRSAFAAPSGNEKIMLVMAIVCAAVVVISLLLGKGLGLLALIAAVVGAVSYFKYRSDRIEARARYDGDSNYTSGFA
ncbi:MAG TPA: hypothetical protein VF548_08940 [Allosphingosinicella sp.]|jgi:hypothetical protein